MNARAKSTTGTAREQGYKVLTDEELTRITEGRVAQLEAELAGHRGLLEEMDADPHQQEDADDPQNPVTSTRNIVASIEVRLNEVLHPRLDALRANVKAATEKAAKAAKAAAVEQDADAPS